MKKLALLALIGLSSLSYAQDKNAIVHHNLKTISLNTAGEIKAAPDQATINIHLEKRNKNAELLSKEISKISDELDHILKWKNIKKEDIQTTNVSFNKDYQWINNKRKHIGYIASIHYRVILKDLKKLETLYPKLIANENINVNGIQYGLTNPKEKENEAYLLALKNANNLASLLLTESGYQQKSIVGITNNGTTPIVYPRRPIYEAKSMMMSSDTAQPETITINEGLITIKKQLTVIFEMK